MNAAKLAFDLTIAVKASTDELHTARKLGLCSADAFDLSYAVLDDVLAISDRPMPQMVLTTFRPMVRR